MDLQSRDNTGLEQYLDVIHMWVIFTQKQCLRMRVLEPMRIDHLTQVAKRH